MKKKICSVVVAFMILSFPVMSYGAQQSYQGEGVSEEEIKEYQDKIENALDNESINLDVEEMEAGDKKVENKPLYTEEGEYLGEMIIENVKIEDDIQSGGIVPFGWSNTDKFSKSDGSYSGTITVKTKTGWPDFKFNIKYRLSGSGTKLSKVSATNNPLITYVIKTFMYVYVDVGYFTQHPTTYVTTTSKHLSVKRTIRLSTSHEETPIITHVKLTGGIQIISAGNLKIYLNAG